MASMRKEISIDVKREDVWAAVRDFGAVHTRLVPGFVTECRIDGDSRIVTFANGAVARELLVDCNDTGCRLVYAVISEKLKHHNASVEVLQDGPDRSKIIWTSDFLPDAIAEYMRVQTEQAAMVMKKTLEKNNK